MLTDKFVLRALRKEDFLDLTFELVNLHTEGTPQRLVRSTANEPALLIVHFPPQHIVEQIWYPSSFLSAQAMLAGTSRLVFKLPDGQDTWPLTLEMFLNWRNFIPVLAANALPADATAGPGLKPPVAEETALEIPTGLYLSPDSSGVWAHAFQRVQQNGRFELWHTRLGTKEPGGKGIFREGATTRVIWAPDLDIPFTNSLTQKNRSDIACLTSDFSLPQFYIPRSINTRRLMLSMLGAWANLESAWDHPTIIPDRNNHPGCTNFGLEQWQHIIAQGRDQYVKTVTKAFLCDTGHRVSIVTITERTFDAADSGIYSAAAILKQYKYLEIQEPVKDYSNLASSFHKAGREMPFRRIHITNRSTPELEVSDSEPSWPKRRGGKPFLFQMVAEDWEGNTVHFERTLLCVPMGNGQINLNEVVNCYNGSEHLDLRTVQLYAQSVAFAKTEPGSRGKSTLKTDNVVFEAQLVVGNGSRQLPNSPPPFLPTVKTARVHLSAVERLLGRPAQVEIRFDDNYLNNGFERTANQGEIFAILNQKLDLPFPAEKAGGLIKPDTAIQALSCSLGPVADPASIHSGTFDTGIFDKARFLGGITLKDILQVVNFDPAKIIEAADLSPKELNERLSIPDFRMEVPVLTTRALYPPDVFGLTEPTGMPNSMVRPIAMETRFVWKPYIKKYSYPDTKPFFQFLTEKEETGFQNNAQLIVNVRLVTPLDGKPAIYEASSYLKEFALDFVGTLKLKFASLSFHAESGKKMDVSGDGMELVFEGALSFVNTLKNILPPNGFSDPPCLDVTASGIRAGYTLAVPSVGVGIFSLQNISLSAALSLPFTDQPAGIRFAISERHKPFLVTVGIFGGGGFFTLALNAGGIEQIEGAIEFGGNVSLNLCVASGGVYVMAGIYFGMAGSEVTITGYLRCGGYLSVLGLIAITVEFYLALKYRDKGNDRGEVWGQASVTIGIQVAFFSKSVTLTVERKFAGAAGDPTFDQLVDPGEWEEYCLAFA